MKNKCFSFLLYVTSIILSACNGTSSKISDVIKLAGDNKIELQKAIKYFKTKDDKLQLQALYFLIENMPGKGWVEYKPYFADGTLAPFYPFNMVDSVASINKKNIEDSAHNLISYNISGAYEDIKVIKATYLIENIELAFEAWKQPWASHLSFKQFCEYILPYRFGTEPLTRWRKQVTTEMKWMFDSIKFKSQTALSACSLVNDSIKRRFKFKHDYLLFYPYNLSYKEAVEFKGGRCDDLNLIAAYWMRAVGIPVINDFTPVWANSNFGGHTWLSVLTENNRSVPFNSAYDNPILDSLPFKNDKLCKIYRRQYQKQENTFRANFPDEPQYLGFLFTDNYFDVTKGYLPTKDIAIPITESARLYMPYAYLGVLSQTDWKTNGYGKVVKNMIYFKDFGKNTLYTAFFQRQDTLQILTKPFLINNDGKLIFFNANTGTTNLTINIKKDYWWLRKERKYVLTIWQKNKWQNLNPSIKWNGKNWIFSECSLNESKDSFLIYKNLSLDAIYRFKNIEPINDIGTYGRPFTIVNETSLNY